MLDHFQELLAIFVSCWVCFFVYCQIAFFLAVRQKASHCSMRFLCQPLLASVFKTRFKKKKPLGVLVLFLLKHNQNQITYSRHKLERLNSMSVFSCTLNLLSRLGSGCLCWFLCDVDNLGFQKLPRSRREVDLSLES